MNTLYFGDNLEIMREMDGQRINLIATDPPFNSGRDYNAFIIDSQAQNKAFTDTWTWGNTAKKARADIRKLARANDTYKALDNALKGYDLLLQNAVSGNKGAMRAYLAFMGPRLAEMHRVLREDGSLYLHCDPTASHYLKGLLDAIFDQSNRKKNEFFRNEIVWCYKSGGATTKYFAKKHDIILFYSKSNTYKFNPVKEKSYQGIGYNTGNKNVHLYEDEHVKNRGPYTLVNQKDWWEIGMLATSSKERLGYETQKPRILYERIIKASSNPNDLILDPFCGCGTTVDAAHTLNRQWLGIDLTILALDPMERRMRERHNLRPSIDYEISGYPTNMQEVRTLVKDRKKYHDFSNWAVTRLGLQPTPDVSDGGKDGIGHVMVWNPEEMEGTPARILAEVKSGKPTLTEVRGFCHTMDKLEAVAGIFITIESVTDGMRQIAADMGTFEHNNTTYPRLQFWQIDDTYFDDNFDNEEIIKSLIELPSEWLRPIRKSEQHFAEEQTEFRVD